MTAPYNPHPVAVTIVQHLTRPRLTLSDTFRIEIRDGTSSLVILYRMNYAPGQSRCSGHSQVHTCHLPALEKSENTRVTHNASIRTSG